MRACKVNCGATAWRAWAVVFAAAGLVLASSQRIHAESTAGEGCGKKAATAATPATSGEDDNPHLWRPQTRSVAVFKNGLGFFMREGDVRLRQGWCQAKHVPPAAFGSLAIYAWNEHQVVDIVGSGPGEVVEFDGHDAPKDVASKRTRLEGVRNLNVKFYYQCKGQQRSAAGKVVAIDGRFVVLDSDSQNYAVPIEAISKMQVLELPLRVHVQGEQSDPPQQARLGMAYLRKGITWIPEYTLKILDDQTAELTLRGTLVNEAEDLIHTDVHLVVGVPHFVHTDYQAPLVLGQVLHTIGTAVAAHRVPSQVASQVMNRAALTANQQTGPQFDQPVIDQPTVPRDLNQVLGNLPQMGGAAASDYTVYTKKDLTLRIGEKAIVTLFVKRIAYGHIYRWSPPKPMEHSLVLVNQTDTPWTTGPCLALNGDQPLSEDLLAYTPKNGRGELPVTAAINIAHEKNEREVDRQLKAHSPTRDVYLDLVTVEGQIKLRNFEKRVVDMVLNVPVPGKPISAEQSGTYSADSQKLRLLEREGTVRWQLRVEPNEEKMLHYKYERYVPAQ